MLVRRVTETDLACLPPALAELSSPVLSELLAQSYVSELEDAEVVVDEGCFEPPVLIVLKGVLSLWARGGSSTFSLFDFVLAQTMFIGGILARDVSPCDVRGAGATLVLCLPLDQFRVALNAEPQLGARILSLEVQSHNKSLLAKAAHASASLEVKLAQLYWNLSTVDARGDRAVEMKLSQQQLAGYFGVAREEISRKSQNLERAGYIEKKGHRVRLTEDLNYLLSPYAMSASKRNRP